MQNIKYGVDISAHQNADTIQRLNEKAEIAIIRLGYGTYTVDKKFHQFIKEAIAKGLTVAVYLASYAKDISEAMEEARFAAKTIEPYREHIKAVYFDFEYFSSDYIKGKGVATTPALVQSLTTAFCEEIIKNGYKAGFYSNLDYIKRFYTDGYIKNNPWYSFWYARPGLSLPDKDCHIWQYASNNGLEDYGYNGNIDKNVFYESFFKFIQEGEAAEGGQEPPIAPSEKDCAKCRQELLLEIEKLLKSKEG